MEQAFVWFHNSSEHPKESISFYVQLLGWKSVAGPPGMTMLSKEKAPFAAVGKKEHQTVGWVPYAHVENLDQATQRAIQLGATVVQEKRTGPAGEFTLVRDPGGATIALWQKG
jgi:uncharacterized protein